MKRKMVLLLCMAVVATSLVGCAKDVQKSDLSNLKNNIANELGEVTQETVGREYTLSTYAAGSMDNVYTIDENGNEINHYNLKDYQSVFDKLGVNIESAIISGIYDGIMYFYNYNYDADVTMVDFYALDTATSKTEKFFSVSTDYGVSRVDYYNDKLYIDIREYETNKHEEHVFAKAEDSLTFTEEESAISDILEQAGDNYVYAADKDSCYTRSYDKYGFLISVVADDNDSELWSYYKVTTDEAIAIDSLQKVNLSFDGYSDKWVYMTTYGQPDTVLVCYDIENDVQHKITKVSKSGLLLGYDNDTAKVYYYEAAEKKYGISDYSFYCYDCSKDSATPLYKQSTIPGTGHTIFGKDGFTLINGQIYAIELAGNTAGWVKFDTDKNIFADLNMPLAEYSVFKYGTVNYDSHEDQCPYCGIAIYKDYTENFVLDPKYSAHADEINALLAPSLEYTPQEISEADCQEMHADYPEQSCETDETYVDNVQIINDRYLAVEITGYWYGGGAHGMPSDGQRIFDLTTGEELGLYDFFSGSEDEFKALVAEKIKEDYTKNPSPYFAGSTQEAYDQAYEYTSEGDVFFESDHITYKFAPYIMGPFASGYITVDIPYTELLGTTTLNRL
ncbi:Protein of unknown function [Pseudobutyrivibrio sp. ACV-2]|uniref:RsiV family protein n=1 Tax=Pseudobutyrivibrio sp. ACV-2 TaxID=1520801 RepID=UPI0008972F12|nr:RsiV family protein [Pseudobutyrivibrio sp. ACV-2]SEA64775.1 Protein of unknown function [Pseudobutyrivibrio sp. ACV-2]